MYVATLWKSRSGSFMKGSRWPRVEVGAGGPRGELGAGGPRGEVGAVGPRGGGCRWSQRKRARVPMLNLLYQLGSASSSSPQTTIMHHRLTY